MNRTIEQANDRPRLLIEEWLPIAKIGVESVRERTPMTPFPAPNRLHVWWARRPLVASRAAILASLLPAEADPTSSCTCWGFMGTRWRPRCGFAQATRDWEFGSGRKLTGKPGLLLFTATRGSRLAAENVGLSGFADN